MSENSKIEWTDHTFNPWIGCTRVSPACDHCYAAVSTPARAMGIKWGAGEPRHRTAVSTWKQPLSWNGKHAVFYAVHGRRQRIFCASLADVFDNAVDPQWRSDLFDLIEATPNLDWLLLTKRIGNVSAMLPANWGDGWRNVWIGATVVSQLEVDRDVPKLLALPAAVRFLSIEPILGPIDLRRYFTPTGVQCPDECQDTRYVLETEVDTYTVGSEINPLCPQCGEHAGWTGYDSALDWVVVGGESGHQARPMHPTWPRSLRDQCRVAAVPFLFKQWGEWSEFANEEHYTHCGAERHPHAWIDGATGEHGRCWIVDEEGVWSNHTGSPRTEDGEHVASSVAVWAGTARKQRGERSMEGFTTNSPTKRPALTTIFEHCPHDSMRSFIGTLDWNL